MLYNPNDYDPSKDFSSPVAGDYDFKVISSEEKKSKSGNDMIEMKLEICPAGRKAIAVKDWLVFKSDCINKIKGFCDATGLNFASGSLDAQDCLGLCGRARFSPKESTIDGKKYLSLSYYYPSTRQYQQNASTQIPKGNGLHGEALDEDGIPF